VINYLNIGNPANGSPLRVKKYSTYRVNPERMHCAISEMYFEEFCCTAFTRLAWLCITLSFKLTKKIGHPLFLICRFKTLHFGWHLIIALICVKIACRNTSIMWLIRFMRME
jgi:hypothetical protein